MGPEFTARLLKRTLTFACYAQNCKLCKRVFLFMFFTGITTQRYDYYYTSIINYLWVKIYSILNLSVQLESRD